MIMLLEHTRNGSLDAWVFLNRGGTVSVVCRANGVETCHRKFPRSYTAEAHAAANHYVLGGHCPACPGSAEADPFWPQWYAAQSKAKEGGAAC